MVRWPSIKSTVWFRTRGGRTLHVLECRPFAILFTLGKKFLIDV